MIRVKIVPGSEFPYADGIKDNDVLQVTYDDVAERLTYRTMGPEMDADYDKYVQDHTHTCLRCEGSWIGLTINPKICAKCLSPYWSRPRKTAPQPAPPYQDGDTWYQSIYIGNCGHQWPVDTTGKNTRCPQCGLKVGVSVGRKIIT